MKGLVCHCGATLEFVIETRQAEGAIGRRRQCKNGHRTTTMERVAVSLHKRTEDRVDLHAKIALCLYTGMTARETAAHLQIGISTVNRARARLTESRLTHDQLKAQRAKAQGEKVWKTPNRPSPKTPTTSPPKSQPSQATKTTWFPEPSKRR